MDGDTKVNADPVSSSQDQSHASHVDNNEETELKYCSKGDLMTVDTISYSQKNNCSKCDKEIDDDEDIYLCQFHDEYYHINCGGIAQKEGKDAREKAEKEAEKVADKE